MKRGSNSEKVDLGGDPIRLQRLLAAAGYGSRRSVESLIAEGRVEVDGKTVSELGVKVDAEVNNVRVDGELIRVPRPLYFAVNKPEGVVTTNRDPEGRPRVIEFAPPEHRLFPVGRLDMYSEGLILLTNDGWLAQRLAHPRYGVEKIYHVTIAGSPEFEFIKKIERGIHLAEGIVKAKHARIRASRGKSTELEIVLDEGKNREIRRMLARVGHKVLKLRRVAYGPLRLGDLPVGACRPLTKDEIRKLRETAAGIGLHATRKPVMSPKKVALNVGKNGSEEPHQTSSRKTFQRKVIGDQGRSEKGAAKSQFRNTKASKGSRSSRSRPPLQNRSGKARPKSSRR
jgi:23S rRNA pseudouridine2605 synthase